MVDPIQTLSDALGSIKRVSAAAITQPEDAYQRFVAVVGALGDIAALTARPLEAVIANQRTVSNAMANFAALQADMAEVVAQLAASHAAVLDAMEALANPLLALSDVISSDSAKKAQKRAGDS